MVKEPEVIISKRRKSIRISEQTSSSSLLSSSSSSSGSSEEENEDDKELNRRLDDNNDDSSTSSTRNRKKDSSESTLDFWTAQEDILLSNMKRDDGVGLDISWEEVAEKLPGRSIQSCQKRWAHIVKFSSGNIRRKWTPTEDKYLIEMKLDGQLKNAEIATRLPGRTILSCQHRWNVLTREKLNWSSDEDALLCELRGDGLQWEDIAKKIPGRSSVGCQLRWKSLFSWLFEETGPNGDLNNGRKKSKKS